MQQNLANGKFSAYTYGKKEKKLKLGRLAAEKNVLEKNQYVTSQLLLDF